MHDFIRQYKDSAHIIKEQVHKLLFGELYLPQCKFKTMHLMYMKQGVRATL